MIRLPCPHCGERDYTEFTYGGAAEVPWPSLKEADGEVLAPPSAEELEAWNRAVFLRDNPRGPHRELWHHSQGCRLWLVVERDTLTHEVLGVRLAERGGETP